MTGGELCSLKDNTEKWVCCFQFFSFGPFLIKSFSGAERKKAAEDLSLTFFFSFFFSYLSRQCPLLRSVKFCLVFSRFKLLPEDLQ